MLTYPSIMSETVKLYYIDACIKTYRTAAGYIKADGMEAYDGVSLKGKVVVRIDIIKSMTECLSPDFLEENTVRDWLWRLVACLERREEVLSKMLMTLYKADDVFKQFLGRVYYFNYEKYKESVWNAISRELKRIYDMREAEVCEQLRLQGVRILICCNGYVYASFDDDARELFLTEPYVIEEVSRAKTWDGKTCRR